MITFVLLLKRTIIIGTFLTQVNTVGTIRQKIAVKWFHVAYSMLLNNFTTLAKDPISIGVLLTRKKNVIRKVTNAIPRSYHNTYHMHIFNCNIRL